MIKVNVMKVSVNMRFRNYTLAVGVVLGAIACTTTSQKNASTLPTPKDAPAPHGTPPSVRENVVSITKVSEPGTRLETECKKDADRRLITVVPQNEGCELYYDKFGKSVVVAHSTRGSTHCDGVQAKMKRNLEEHGFKCN